MDKQDMVVDRRTIDKIIKERSGKPGALLGTLEEVQELNEFKYLPKETLEYIAEKTDIPVSQVYSVATFYAFFNLVPQGEHCIVVCRGTACHTKGSKFLLDGLLAKMGLDSKLDEGESFVTSADKKFTVRTVACFGQCALAPVVSVDGNIYSNVTEDRLRKLLEGIKGRGKKK